MPEFHPLASNAEIDHEPRFRTRVTAAEKAAPQTTVLRLERPKDFAFHAGQYVWLILPHRSAERGTTDRRAYSIASGADAQDLEFIIRETENGFDGALKSLKPGEEVEFVGPFGSAFVPPDAGAIMVSGGAAIAPFLGILRSRLPGKFTLYAFEKAGSPLHCKDELQDLAKREGTKVSVIAGEPTAEHLDLSLPPDDDRPILVAGTTTFVTAATAALTGHGIDADRIAYEQAYPENQVGNDIREIFSQLDDTGRISTGTADYMHQQAQTLSEIKLAEKETEHKFFTAGFLFVTLAISLVLSVLLVLTAGHFPWLQFVFVIALLALIVARIVSKNDERVGAAIVFVSFLSLLNSRIDPTITHVTEPWFLTFPILARKFLRANIALPWTGLFIAIFIALTTLGNRGLFGLQPFPGSITQYVVAMVFVTILTQTSARRETLFTNELQKQIARQKNLLVDFSRSLRLSEIFTQLAEQTSQHVVLTDNNGKVLYANKAAERLTGYKFKEMRGQTPRLWGGLMSPTYYKKLWKRKSHSKIVSQEVVNRRKDGTLYTALGRITPILRDGKVGAYVATEEDITRLKEVDKAKSELISLASHQLRTPLSIISWYAEMLLSGDAGKINKKQHEYLGEIARGNQRMVDMVGSLLNVSRVEHGGFAIAPEPTDLAKLMQEQIDALRPEIEDKRLAVTLDADPALPKYNVDPKLTGIVFQNLITNAVKYTPKDGKIRAEMRRANGDVSISIADTGVGIPKQEQEKIFSKLYRASNAQAVEPHGNGLGLYIVKSIVEQAGGTIKFTSEEGVGTVFTVTFPEKGMVRIEGRKRLA